jgi:hypothetical protein
MAQEMAKYTYPGVVESGPPQPGQKPGPVVPENLAQLRLWVEGEQGGSIDVLA